MTPMVLPSLLAALSLQSATPPLSSSPVTAALVTVTAAGPRLWRLVRGGSTVWVLGEVSPLPRGLAWNSAPAARVLRGANRLLLPPEGTAGIMDALGALARSRLPGGASLGSTLPPNLERRYRAVLVRLGRNADKVRHDKPGWAALWLELNFITWRGVDASEPARTLRALARAAHVPVRQVATYRRTDILGELVSLPQAEGEAALSDAVDDVAFGLDHVEVAGRAWAVGDAKTALADTRPGETPLGAFLHTPAGRRTQAQAVDDTADALRSALTTPGVTVALVRMATLLEPNGVLDRMRAEGVTVSEPTTLN